MRASVLRASLSALRRFDDFFRKGAEQMEAELAKQPKRYDVINFLLSQLPRSSTFYLEIGLRDPADNFDRVKSHKKYSVDPGIEFAQNPATFRMTSDDFFSRVQSGELIDAHTKFDVIFIDGLHVADQVDRDIANALRIVAPDGFIVVHDCNPPSEFFARETKAFVHSPAGRHWNGTTWKAFCKWRCDPGVTSCCIDTDWGLGIITRLPIFSRQHTHQNPFFDFRTFDVHRQQILNLMSFDDFQSTVSAHFKK